MCNRQKTKGGGENPVGGDCSQRITINCPQRQGRGLPEDHRTQPEKAQLPTYYSCEKGVEKWPPACNKGNEKIS